MTLKEAHAVIARHCGEISDLMKDKCRVTILVRNPDFGKLHPNSADILVSDDDCDSIIQSVKYLSTREERTL